jgi:lysozyme
MKIGQKGLDLIKSFEGLRLEAYLCPAKIRTIGFGHTGDDVRDGMKITKEEAEKLLQKDLEKFEKTVSESVKVPINRNQFDALVCFSFNVGPGALKSSTLLKLVNENKFKEAADQFIRWNKANGKELAGLTRRRESEKLLFLTPTQQND